MLILRLCLSIISLFFIGYPLVYYLLINKSPPSSYRGFSGRAFIFFISFYTGILLAVIFMMILSIAGVALSFQAVVGFASVFFIFSVFLIARQEQRNRRHRGSCNPDKKSLPEIDNQKTNNGPAFFYNRNFINAVFTSVIFLIVVNFLVVVFFTFLFPIRFWDAISCWSLKGRAFFIDSSIFPFFTDHGYGFSHLSYPLYIPLLQTWVYQWLGVIDETLVKVIFPVIYLSLIFLFYYIFRQKFNKLFSITVVFILSTLPIVMDHGYMEYTNLVFSIILFMGVYCFYLYISSDLRKANLLVLSTLFFSILTQIRTEGLIFLVVFLTVNMIIAIVRILNVRVKRLKYGRRQTHTGSKQIHLDRKAGYLDFVLSIISPILLAFFLMLPWLYVVRTLGLSALSSEWSALLVRIQDQNQNVLYLLDVPAGIKAIAAGIFYSSFDSARAFLGASYGIVWAVMLVLLIVNFKRAVRNYNWIFPVFILTGFISLLFSFALIEEFIWSTDRYLLHLLPLTYFWIFYNLPLFENRLKS